MSGVRIEKLNRRGEGEGGGKSYRHVLPGEMVDDATGAVLEASANRIEPFCLHYGRCGGCQLQHWADAPYGAWKAGLVASALKQRGIQVAELPLLDAHGGGRRRVVLHARRREGKAQAGFMAARSHQLVDIDACPILVGPLQGAADIARAIGAVAGDCDVALTAAANGIDVAVKAERKQAEISLPKLTSLAVAQKLTRLSLNGDVLVAQEQPFVRMGNANVPLPPGSFLQATEEGENTLARLVLEGVGKARKVADLFCGLGPFALRLAEAAQVTAIDSDKPAIAALQSATRATQGLKPIVAQVRNLMSEPLVASELKEFEAVVFDPPRAGAEAQAKKLAASTVKRVVAVSCDPDSFARDAAILTGGGYKIEKVTAVDQFKYSTHVECVGVFRR